MATLAKLGEKLRSRIQHLAEARQCSSHSIMREAIRVYVDHEEKRELLKRDALMAWETYKQNGLHVTQEEADSWLEKLAAGEDVEPPKCHV